MSNQTTMLLEAASFAAEMHGEQRRLDRSGSPYINHPLAVASLLAEMGAADDVDLLIAALLHDVVEDTPVTSEQVAERFGQQVANLVAEVTDDKSLAKPDRKRLQVETASSKSPQAKQLKLADKICNIRELDANSPADWSVQRKLEYADWSEAVIAGCRNVNPRLDALFDQELAAARARLAK